MNDLAYLNKMVAGCIIKVVGNKKDLVSEEQLAEVKAKLEHPWDVITSAKTGEKVEDLFMNLGHELLK